MHTVCFKLIDYKSYNLPTCKIKNNIRTTQIIYSIYWYLGGYGILPYPRSPLAYPPTEATELAEVSGGEEPPTDTS